MTQDVLSEAVTTQEPTNVKVKDVVSDFLGNGEILTIEKGVSNHNLVFAMSNVNVKCIRAKVVVSKEEVEYANFDLMNTIFAMLRSGMNVIYDKVSDEERAAAGIDKSGDRLKDEN